jgi:hypothetical protein
LLYEWSHLKRKLKQRDPKRHREFATVKTPDSHPLFKIVPGEIRAWEKLSDPKGTRATCLRSIHRKFHSFKSALGISARKREGICIESIPVLP